MFFDSIKLLEGKIYWKTVCARVPISNIVHQCSVQKYNLFGGDVVLEFYDNLIDNEIEFKFELC